jgi:hypothetical protein
MHEYIEDMKCMSGKHEWIEASDAEKCCNGYQRLYVHSLLDIPSYIPESDIKMVHDGFRFWMRMDVIRAEAELDLENRESIVNFLFEVDHGYMSCRYAADLIMKKVEEIKNRKVRNE